MLLHFHIGGLFFRDGVAEEMQSTFTYAQEHTKIPLLIPSNLEAGGDGAATNVQLQMIRYMHIVWERLPAQKEVH